MPRLIILLLIGLFILYFIYRYKRLPEADKSKYLKTLVVAAAMMALLFLVFTGRLNWLVGVIGALVPLVPRMVRFVMSYGPTLLPFLKRYQQNRQSQMQSDFLKLHFDILSGDLRGEVLSGRFQGSDLAKLSQQDMLSLLQEYQGNDSKSYSMLLAYIQRQHPEWLAGQSYESSASQSDMTVQQARDILGLDETATKEDVSKAHKRLMQKIHPDRGGSEYLAQQINRARDVLLDALKN